MTKEEIMKKLKDLPNRVLNVAVEERNELFHSIYELIRNSGCNNSTVVKGLCKVVCLTLTKYKDHASQLLVRNLIVELLQEQHDIAVEYLVIMLKVLAEREIPNAPPSKGGKAAIIALGWTVLIMQKSRAESNVFQTEKAHLVELQARFYQLIFIANNARLVDIADKLMFDFFGQVNAFEEYACKVVNMESTTTSILFVMLLMRFEQQNGFSTLITYKKELLDHFVKVFIMSKCKPQPNYILACHPLLHTISYSEFERIIFPPLQRATLRNPEIILQAVGFIIKHIQFDLSDFALQLEKVLLQNLCSKDETTRIESMESLKQITKKCSKTETLSLLLTNVFGLLNGSNGKINVAEYRLNLIQAAGNLSYNAVPQKEITALQTLAIDYFSKSLVNEIQEKVICFTLDMFSLWVINLNGELLPRIVQILKVGLNQLKTTTPTVRLAYLQWFLAALQNTILHNDLSLTKIMVSIVERAIQTPHQNILVCEATCAVCVLLKTENLVMCGTENVMNVIFDLEKNIFLSERFILTAQPEMLRHTFLMIALLLTEHFYKLKGPLNKIFKTLIHCLTSSSQRVRLYVNDLIPKIVLSSQGVTFLKNILNELESSINVIKIDCSQDCEHSIPSVALMETFQILCEVNSLTVEDAEHLALLSLLICHHPAIFNLEPDLWKKTLLKFNLDPQLYLSKNGESTTDYLLKKFKPQKLFENAIFSLVNINPETLVPILVSKFCSELKALNLNNVTEEEFLIFLTPDGELFEKSVLPTNEDLYTTVRLKRENKVYSYKEQLEELQLRREIEDKRRKEGKIKEPLLTSRQQEVIKSQAEKEKAIKTRLQILNNKLIDLISIIRSASEGNPYYISLYFSEILPAILDGLKSPLAANSLINLYYHLHKTCFEKNQMELAILLAITTIRLEKPVCNLDETWLQKDMSETVVDTLLRLYDITKQANDMNEECMQNWLSPPEFCSAFEFLKRSALEKNVSSNEGLLLKEIDILENHTQKKVTSIYWRDFGHKNPQYLPLSEMFSFLLNIINNYQGEIQTKAVNTILELCYVCSGNENCTTATPNEINTFLVALQNSEEIMRNVALRSLTIIHNTLNSQNDKIFVQKVISRLWIAKFDVSCENRVLANNLWGLCSFYMPELEDILGDIVQSEACIQKAAASALVPLLLDSVLLIKTVINKLLLIYNEKLTMIPPKLDNFDREVEPAIDQWAPRRGVAIALAETSNFFSIEDVDHVMQFLVSHGLGDRNDVVHKEMLSAALTIIDVHGKKTILSLLPVFESFLDIAPKSQSFDNIRQAVVILLGSLARHLEKDDSRIKPIIERLLSALSTPSQQVQEAVTNCLPHLISSVKDEAPVMLKKLLHLLVKSDKYGERRGAAYGIAGIIKGLGILSLKQYDIMSKLTTAIQEKKNYKSREGALFAFEVLCTTLGRLFEPYIVHVLPHLLQCFGDSSQYVRQAADDTAKVVMGKLSAHGVKLVLPALLSALDEDSWRTKTASVEMLGAMAFCAPKQLSSCLPSIVPKLIEVLGDSHTKVQEAGAGALKVIGSVIRNPEIQEIVPVLLKALEDPSTNTSSCLNSLLQTKFVHFIDAPSLALIMPVVQRAFMDRSTETRKMAAQIIGNMYSLTDQKDLTPYLPNIIPGLKMSLLDPVPEVRAISARALGAMVRGMGESSFEDLLPWLMQTLTSESSSVDRSGAAQGLSEVVCGLGVEKLHKLMPEIILTAERHDIAPHVKDGYIMMFIYMPVAFPNEFTPYIGQIINPILKALADENEYVRDTALKAGQRIVNLYAETAVALLLPELEKGLFDENWRIRLSSVQLLGDLLYRISGVSGKMTTETASEDDNFGTEQSHKAIMTFLGEDRRNRVLSGLYMGRSDVSLMVRQAALHVWKVVVTNTPRTLREILPTLFGLLLCCLASTSYDKRQVAARTLGDLVRKLGERVLPEIIPILEDGLASEYSDQRQGVCIGLSEIMGSTSKEMVLSFIDSLVPTVRKALSDPLPEVREAAAKTFDSLHSTVGSRALDDILPTMLEDLSNEDEAFAEHTLDGLRQVMIIKSKVVLPFLVPHLTRNPVNTKALSILISVSGDAVTKYLPKILSALLQALSDAQGQSNENQEIEYCQAVILSVGDEVGIVTIMDTLMSSAKSDDLSTRKSAASLLSAFCLHSRGDYSHYVPQLLRCLMRLLADSDREILQKSWDALNAVIKTLDSLQQIAHVSDVRQAVRFAVSDLKNCELPGFCLPKGITPLLPVFREAILNGLPDEKENAAQGLGEIISLSNAQSLQPSVVHITGPLIRILGDRFNSGVKSAVLETLAILLEKVGVMLKQFLPQLQTTFLKALHDQNRCVRLKAGKALSQLVLIHTRADPLFSEIYVGIKSADDSGVRETMLQALRGVISPAGEKMSETLRSQLCQTLLSMLGHTEDITRTAAGGCLGSIVKYLNSAQISNIFLNNIFVDDKDESPLRHGRSVVIFVALKECAHTIVQFDFQERLFKHIIENISSEKIMIACNSIRAATYLLKFNILNNIAPPQPILVALVRTMNHKSNEVKQLVAKSCNYLSKVIPEEQFSPEVLKYLIPMLVNGTKEKNGYVKSNSEIALVSILRLRENDFTFGRICKILEAGAADSLCEVVTRVLRKAAVQVIEREDELDDSILC